MKLKLPNQKGFTTIAGLLIALAAIGLVSSLLIASSAPLKTNKLDKMFPKSDSKAKELESTRSATPSAKNKNSEHNSTPSSSPSSTSNPSISPISQMEPNVFALSPSVITTHSEEEIPVTISIRTGGDAVNLLSAQLKYDPEVLTVSSVDVNDSFISHWAEKLYNNSDGTLSLVGGVVNGSPNVGFSSEQAVVFAKVNFKIKANSAGKNTKVFIDPSSLIYRNSDNQNILVPPTNLPPSVVVIAVTR